jgi:chitodextrinase
MADKKKGRPRRKNGRRRWIKGWMRDWPFIVFVVVLTVVLVVLALVATGVLFGGGGHGSNNNDHYVLPRAIIDVDKTNIDENDTVTFSGENSRGDIEQYLWYFGDGGEGNGPVVPHMFRNYGRFSVRLTVIDSRGEGHTVTAYIHVHHHEEMSGSMSIGQSKDYVIPVGQYCMGTKVVITYPTGQMISGNPSNVLDITLLLPNGTAYLDSKDQKPVTGSTQTKELRIPSQEMAATFYQDWKVRVSSSSGINVRYDMTVDVYY